MPAVRTHSLPCALKSTSEDPRVLFVVTTAHARLFAVVLVLSVFVLHTYFQVHDSQNGWTKLTLYGADCADDALPRLQHIRHYIDFDPDGRAGYDGQFYGQMAIDPTLRDPAFDRALDQPVYRGRRIGLPAIAFCLGLGKPSRVINAYALSNLLFWFVLLAAMAILMRPWTGQQLLCLSAGMVSYGVVASMERSLTDLPATAMLFVGAVIGSWGGYVAFAAAALTRETSVLAAVGFLESWRPTAWKRNVGMLCLAVLPLVVWMIYVRHRFGPDQTVLGAGNFTLPFQALVMRFIDGIKKLTGNGHHGHLSRLRWLYYDFDTHELLVIAGITFQGLYLVLRRDWHSTFWRTGICYALFASVLGVAVWEETAAASRVLLPMTICFYLLLARERAAWFWPFFIGGSLSIPGSVYDFWTTT